MRFSSGIRGPSGDRARARRRRAATFAILAVAVAVGAAFAGRASDAGPELGGGGPASAAGGGRAVVAPVVAASRRRQRYVSPGGDDRGTGSRSRPWATLAHAAERATPGTTVHVAPGEYAARLTIRRGGTATRRVRFVSDRRWKAVIHATGTGSVAVVEIWGDHVSFEGFDVWGGGTDGAQGIDVEGSDVSVVGNHVHDIATPCPPNGNGGAGIVVGGGKAGYRNHGGVVARNLVQGIGTGPRDGSCRLVHGIYAAVPGVTIVNNIVRDALGDGITSWHAARSLTIANNLATENGGVGVLVGSGDSGAPPAGNIRTVVANNIVSRNAMQGITESTDGKHRVGPGNRYLHNLAFQNHGADPDPAWGIRGLFPGAVVSGTVNADPGLGGAPAPCRCMPSAAGPVVDAGTRVAAPRDDFRGAERPKGRAVDIGPYELR